MKNPVHRYPSHPSPHTFHIPVMGTGFTIDTPLKVARFGISSVISLVDDTLIEQMRQYHCEQSGEPYEPIARDTEDSRARRITAYLNLLDLLVQRQMDALAQSSFDPGSPLSQYFELLPDTPLKARYLTMRAIEPEGPERDRLEAQLRADIVAGSIDVNIMTKLDRVWYRDGVAMAQEYNDAMAALRGYALSDLDSGIVFSAGMNQHLYSYAAQFADFLPTEDGYLKKKIILKVSDFRSAEIQSKLLARKGLWVSEFRMESGLNCGGHAFGGSGQLMGPILEEIRNRRGELLEKNFAIYKKALHSIHGITLDAPPPMRVTAQGGIGTADEHALMLEYFNLDGAGWGTPFLLVPEAVNIDEAHLEKLRLAGTDDVFLSDSSPLGIPFWNLRASDSELAREARIAQGKPGAPCRKGHLAVNTEFDGPPVCRASRQYQEQKLEALKQEGYSPQQLDIVRGRVLAKSCICHDLGGSTGLLTGTNPRATPAICPGPNLAYFSKVATLEEMIGHIYGRLSLLAHTNRPHMFVQELKIYVATLREEVELQSLELSICTQKYMTDFKSNLLDGIAHYRSFAERFIENQKTNFLSDLSVLEEEINSLPLFSSPGVSANSSV